MMEQMKGDKNNHTKLRRPQKLNKKNEEERHANINS
jgi:hypothetical protein